MKTISTSLIALLIVLGTSLELHAQKPFTGKVIYKISMEMEGIPPEAKSMLPTTMVTYISDDKVKTEISTAMGTQSTILNMNEETHVTLMDIMGQKMAIKDTYEELQKEMGDQPEYSMDITGETKEIAGYTAKKVVIKRITSDGEEKTEGQAWFTDELNINPGINFTNPFYRDLDGLLLEYDMDAGNNMKMQLMAVEVSSQKLKKSLFEIPSDYEIITREELGRKIGR
jgi:GLPGLI family protein